MSTSKVSKSEKVRQELVLLKQKKTDHDAKIADNTASMINARNAAIKAHAEMLAAKKRYDQAMSDEKIFTQRHNEFIKQDGTLFVKTDLITQDIEAKDIELAVVVQEETEKNRRPKNKKSHPDYAILAKINKMPEDIVKIIGEYLPYIVRIELLEATQKTSTFLNRVSCQMRYMFLGMMSTYQEFVNMLPPEEAIRQIPRIQNARGQMIANPEYFPFSGKNGVQDNFRIRYILNMAKEVNPQFAFNMMKMIRVLGNPLKKYVIDYNTHYTRCISERRNKLVISNL